MRGGGICWRRRGCDCNPQVVSLINLKRKAKELRQTGAGGCSTTVLAMTYAEALVPNVTDL